MKRLFFYLFVIFSAASAFGQDVSAGVYGYTVSSGEKAVNCHGVKVNGRWLITSAHCVFELCAKKCDITLVGINVSHTPQQARVFVQSGFDLHGDNMGEADIALIDLGSSASSLPSISDVAVRFEPLRR